MNRRITSVLVAALIAAGCAGDMDEQSKRGDSFGNNQDAGFGPTNNASSNNDVIEEEVEFGFSRPAVVGGRVFVANADLNTVAAIDAETARITTIPVGFQPTVLVGPEEAGVDGSVFVLNEGASTVTVIAPDLSTETFDVGRDAGNLAGAPDGSAAVTWFRADDGTAGDLSSVDLVTPDGAYQISVGFNVIDAVFTDDASKLLVTSADGVSVIDVATVEEDGFAPPVPVLPPDLQVIDPVQREIILSPDGRWAVSRVFGFSGLVLTDLQNGDQWVTNLPASPTDIDWVEGDTPRITANLSARSELVVATIPDGFVAASELPYPGQDSMMDADAGMSADAGAGAGDMGMDMGDAGVAADMGDAGVAADMGDVGVGGDMGTGVSDAGPDPSDAGTTNDAGGEATWPETEGFEYVELGFEQLGLTEVGRTGETAFVYTSRTNDGRAILLDLETFDQRLVPFEKGILRVESDAEGEAFVIIHDRVDGGGGGTGTPGDDDFIQSQNGLSILDVASGASSLTLTEEEPQQAVLWDDGEERLLYVAFAPADPSQSDLEDVDKRALATLDLRSFALGRTTLPSLPNGLGTIPSAGKVYISQIHPQGRITFVDVTEGSLRTVTGFQLNAGID